MYVTSIISGSKVFLEKVLLPKDRQFINNTCVKKLDLSRKLYLKSLPKRKGTHNGVLGEKCTNKCKEEVGLAEQLLKHQKLDLTRTIPSTIA